MPGSYGAKSGSSSKETLDLRKASGLAQEIPEPGSGISRAWLGTQHCSPGDSPLSQLASVFVAVALGPVSSREQWSLARVQTARHQNRLRKKASKTATSYLPFNMICLPSFQTNRLRASSGPSQVGMSKIRSDQTPFFVVQGLQLGFASVVQPSSAGCLGRLSACRAARTLGVEPEEGFCSQRRVLLCLQHQLLGSSFSQFSKGSHQISNPQHILIVKFPDKPDSGQVGPQPDLNFQDSFKRVGVASAVLPSPVCCHGRLPACLCKHSSCGARGGRLSPAASAALLAAAEQS